MTTFFKYQRAGNDFILFDFREGEKALSASHLCDRRHGIGADGVLILRPSQVADCQLQIFNADGSEPAMCGNGAYCAIDYLSRQVPEKERWVLKTPHAPLHSYLAHGRRVLNLGPVKTLHFPLELEEFGPCYVVNTGVPHAVFFVSDLEAAPLDEWGRKIRFHPALSPEGANVNFACLHEGQLRMRTYERGVEGETLSCGTGSAAVAFVAKQLHSLSGPIPIFSRQNFSEPHIYTSQLTFSFKGEDVEMGGDAHLVFSGTMQS